MISFLFVNKCHRYLACFCLMAGMVSCSDDGDTLAPLSLTDPMEMYADGKSFMEDELQLKVNGGNLDDSYVTFQPVEGDTTQLLMTVANLMPGHDAQALVRVTSGSGQVTFEGSSDGLYYMPYDLEVTGVYRGADAESEQLLQAECTFTMKHAIIERSYEYHFNDRCLYVSAWSEAEQPGLEGYSKDFVQSVLDKIRLRIAQKFTDAKLVFHADGTFTMWLKPVGQSDYEEWMTPRYWIDGQSMYWLFTQEQRDRFCEQWLGPLNATSSYLFRIVNTSETFYELNLMFWGTREKFDWTISNPWRYYALEMFMQGQWMENLTDEERQEMELFSEVLNNVEDPSHWMSWLILICSETLAD